MALLTVAIQLLIFLSTLSCLFALHLDIHRHDQYYLTVPLLIFIILGVVITSFVRSHFHIPGQYLILFGNGVCATCTWRIEQWRAHRSALMRIASAGFLLGVILHISFDSKSRASTNIPRKHVFKPLDFPLITPYRDPYDVLAIKPNASFEHIMEIFLDKALDVNPGHLEGQPSVDQSIIINSTIEYLKLREAYAILMNPVRRALLDAQMIPVSRGLHLVQDVHLPLSESPYQAFREYLYSTIDVLWELDAYITLPDTEQHINDVLLPYKCGVGMPIYGCWAFQEVDLKSGEVIRDFMETHYPHLWEKCFASGGGLAGECEAGSWNEAFWWLMKKQDRLKNAYGVQGSGWRAGHEEFWRWYREYLVPSRQATVSAGNAKTEN